MGRVVLFFVQQFHLSYEEQLQWSAGRTQIMLDSLDFINGSFPSCKELVGTWWGTENAKKLSNKLNCWASQTLKYLNDSLHYINDSLHAPNPATL